MRKLVTKFGDVIYNLTGNIVYCLSYPIFSIIRGAWSAIVGSWEEAE